MAGLLDLPTEILEHILLQQEDVEDMISLGTSCSRLKQILSKPMIWRNLLTKAKSITMVETKDNSKGLFKKGYRVNTPIVQMLILFLKSSEEPDILFGLLQDTICAVHHLCLHHRRGGCDPGLPPGEGQLLEAGGAGPGGRGGQGGRVAGEV